MSQCYENVQKNELINNYSPVKRRKNVAISNQNIVDQEESSSSSPASFDKVPQKCFTCASSQTDGK